MSINIQGEEQFVYSKSRDKELGTPDENSWPGFSELPHAKKINWERNKNNMLRKRYKDQMPKEGYNFLNG